MIQTPVLSKKQTVFRGDPHNPVIYGHNSILSKMMFYIFEFSTQIKPP